MKTVAKKATPVVWCSVVYVLMVVQEVFRKLMLRFGGFVEIEVGLFVKYINLLIIIVFQ